jgi:acyl carrier protein
LPDVSIDVLRDGAWPTRIGELGEIHIGGAGVSVGYVGDAALTAARFLPSPGGARLYRTGDLARWGERRQLCFYGRNDAQIKLRGNRVDLAEIESAICAHPSVLHAAVAPQGELANATALAAFYVRKPATMISADDMRSFLAREKLPAHLLPSSFREIETLPLSASGKLDRRALAQLLDASPAAPLSALELHDQLERDVAEIWSGLLQRRIESRDGDFFALGGHSMQVMELLWLIEERFGARLDPRALYEAPSLALFAAKVRAASSPGRRPDPL